MAHFCNGWQYPTFYNDGIASKEMLMLAKQARDQFEEVTKVITERDFQEPGDSAEGPF